jgi:hypothetical protein
MKVDILTYQRNTWFSKKIWVAICQTKLHINISPIYAETEYEAFEKMKNKIVDVIDELHQKNSAVRTLNVTIWNCGNMKSCSWDGPPLFETNKRNILT